MASDDDVLLETRVDRGMYVGWSWRTVVEQEPEYAEWAVAEWEGLSTELREAVQMALEERNE